MLRLAFRQIRLDSGRSVLTCVGIAAVLAVILVLQGFQQGLYRQLEDVALARNADLIATQAGVTNMVAARSVIPQMVRERVEAVDGVKLAHPMTALSLIYEKDGKKTAVFLTVTETRGGPSQTIQGRLIQNDGEVVIDRALAQHYGLTPGQDLVIAGYPFKIVGVTETTAAMFTSFVFTNFGSLIDFYFETKLADDISAFPLLSYLLIELEPGADRQVVKDRVEKAVADVDVFLPETIAKNDEQLGRTMFGAVLAILIGVAYIAGALVVALFMFSAAEARRRDLGVLKAIGFPNRALLGSIVVETVLLTVAAVPLGIALAMGLAAGIHAAMPTYLVLPTIAGPLIATIVACAFFALLGAVGPFRLIKNLEPAEVFQS